MIFVIFTRNCWRLFFINNDLSHFDDKFEMYLDEMALCISYFFSKFLFLLAIYIYMFIYCLKRKQVFSFEMVIFSNDLIADFSLKNRALETYGYLRSNNWLMLSFTLRSN